jgi:MFS transporter, UMF1 family
MGEMDKQVRKRGEILSWSMYDWASSAFATTIMAAVLPIYYSRVAGAELGANTATVYWGYTLSIALLVTAVLAPVMGAIADYSGLKKRFLLTFAAVGIFATALLYFVTSGDWFIASLFFIFGNLGFSMSDVFYNSLLPSVSTPKNIDRVSTMGYALGYLGGGILLAINILMIELIPDKIFATRLCFVSVSIWWAIFTVPLILKVREPEIKSEKTNPHLNPVRVAFRRIYVTFGELRKYRELFLFLIAFWVYNDGIGTIIKMAAIYGAEIGIGQTSLIGALLMTQFVGIPFTFAFGRLAGYLGTKNSILLGLTVYTGIAIGAYFMETAVHFWILAFMVGTVQGGTQALSRSLFGSMLPRDKTCEFFGFYGMSSKFAGIVGPLTFALVSQIMGSSRLAIVMLVVFFIGGAILLLRVDEKKGLEHASNTA